MHYTIYVARRLPLPLRGGEGRGEGASCSAGQLLEDAPGPVIDVLHREVRDYFNPPTPTLDILLGKEVVLLVLPLEFLEQGLLEVIRRRAIGAG